MLTSVYYYGYYRPYILEKNQKSAGTPKKSVSGKAAKSRAAGGLAGNVRLEKNNSVKPDVIRYARGVFKNITEMKDSAKYLYYDAENFFLNVLDEDFETAKEWAAEDLSRFAAAFNETVEFGLAQTHSAELSSYATGLAGAAAENKPFLETMGISLSDDGNQMSFNCEKLAAFDYLEFGAALSELRPFAANVYEQTAELLSRPLSDHMRFKQLNYYYNYRLRSTGTAAAHGGTFMLIESGILLDSII